MTGCILRHGGQRGVISRITEGYPAPYGGGECSVEDRCHLAHGSRSQSAFNEGDVQVLDRRRAEARKRDMADRRGHVLWNLRRWPSG